MCCARSSSCLATAKSRRASRSVSRTGPASSHASSGSSASITSSTSRAWWCRRSPIPVMRSRSCTSTRSTRAASSMRSARWATWWARPRSTSTKRRSPSRRSAAGTGRKLSSFAPQQHVIPTALVWDAALSSYSFGPDHPLNPRRLELTLSLIRSIGLLDRDVPVLVPRAASDEDLARVHAPEYIAAVKRMSQPGARVSEGLRWGLGTGDVPIVSGMHDASALVAGATLTAAEAVMTGRVKRAFSIAGGLHHAKRAEASGFCVYSDLAVGIEYIRRVHGARVMYIDYDAHHGDGVQDIFYEDPDVLTVSFHESGAYLFPGTGFIDEVGEGDGYGYSVNVPLEPHTGDESFRACFLELVPALAEAFRPDVIVLQNGCDAHALDPLTHLRCTTPLFEELV